MPSSRQKPRRGQDRSRRQLRVADAAEVAEEQAQPRAPTAAADRDSAMPVRRRWPADAVDLAPLRQAANQAVRVRSHLLDRLVAQAGEVIITRSRLEVELGQLRGFAARPHRQPGSPAYQLRDIEVQAESQMQSRLAQAKDSRRASTRSSLTASPACRN